MESWEQCSFSLLEQQRSESDGLNRLVLRISTASWWVRFVQFCLPFTLLQSTSPGASLLCLAFLFSLSPSLTHAVSKQTVLSRSISGCHAVDEKNKIKNRRREKGRYFPAAYGSRKLKSLYSESDTQQKGQFVTETQTHTLTWNRTKNTKTLPHVPHSASGSHWLH